MILFVFFFLENETRDLAEMVPFDLRWNRQRNQTGSRNSRLSSMSSEIGLAVGARVMHVHALVDAARNQTAAEPATKKCNQKAGNVRDEAGRRGGLGVDLRVAAGTDHVRRLGANGNHGGDDGRPRWLGHVRHEGTSRGNATDGLCIAGWSRLGWYETVRRRGFLAHFRIGIPFRWWWQLLMDFSVLDDAARIRFLTRLELKLSQLGTYGKTHALGKGSGTEQPHKFHAIFHCNPEDPDRRTD